MFLYIFMKKIKSDLTYELFVIGLFYLYCGISMEFFLKKLIKLIFLL